MSADVLACGRCGRSLFENTNPLGGSGRCPGCGVFFRVEVFPALFHGRELPRTGEALMTETESSCFYHPDKRAATPCDCCGRFLCALCDIELDGRHLCAGCVSAERAKGRIERLENQRVLYDVIALDAALIPLALTPCFWWLLPLLSPVGACVALYVALRYRKAPGRIPPRRRWRTGLAVSLAVVQLIAWMAAVAALLDFLVAG